MIKDVHGLNKDIKETLNNRKRQLDHKNLYRKLFALRQLEELLGVKYKAEEIRGFCHLVIGQKNIYVALEYVLGNKDKVITDATAWLIPVEFQ
jgi:pyruvate dehydrogenase E1 component alpha subunit